MNTNDPRLSKMARKWLDRGYLEYSCPVSDLDKYGVYHIKGEDPNCADLGYLEGPLWAVINEAVETVKALQESLKAKGYLPED